MKKATLLLALGLAAGAIGRADAQTMISPAQQAFQALAANPLVSLPSNGFVYSAVPCTIGASGCPATGYKVQLLAGSGLGGGTLTAAQIAAALNGQTSAQVATLLGLGGAAAQPTSAFDAAGAASAAQAASAQRSANLSDLANPATARSNLGLKGGATMDVGTAAGTLAGGDVAAANGAAAAAAQATASAALPAAKLGAANGAAGLDANQQVPASQLQNILAALYNRTPIAPLVTSVGATPVTVFAALSAGVFAHMEIPLAASNSADTQLACTFDGSTPSLSGGQIISPGSAFTLPDDLGVSTAGPAKCVSNKPAASIAGTANLPLGAN